MSNNVASYPPYTARFMIAAYLLALSYRVYKRVVLDFKRSILLLMIIRIKEVFRRFQMVSLWVFDEEHIHPLVKLGKKIMVYVREYA